MLLNERDVVVGGKNKRTGGGKKSKEETFYSGEEGPSKSKGEMSRVAWFGASTNQPSFLGRPLSRLSRCLLQNSSSSCIPGEPRGLFLPFFTYTSDSDAENSSEVAIHM